MSFKNRFSVTLAIVVLVVGSVYIADADDGGCQKKCRQTFPPHTTDISHAADSCERGCRLFLLIDGVAKSADTDDAQKDVIKNCKHSCEDSFETSKDKSGSIAACQSGCEFQTPSKPKPVTEVVAKIPEVVVEKKPEVVESGEAQETDKTVVVEDQQAEFPFFNFGFPQFMSDDSDASKFFADARKSMMEMHNRMMNMLMSNDDDVVDSNDVDDIFKQVFDMRNDMMMRPNPLDQLLDSDNFEMIDGSKAKESDKGSMEKTFVPNRIFEIEIIGPFRVDSAQINGIELKDDLDFEGPRLPEDGLKSRQFEDAESVFLDQICRRDSKEMSWSDLATCIHHRMRTPRWLTVATIALSVIFIIWLCLVIPSNAPKQRVRIEKDVFVVPSSAKEKEAQAYVSIRMSGSNLPNDLPPSYDEVANLQVKLEPVHQPLKGEDETKSTKI